MNRNFKFFIGAVLTVLYLTVSIFASATTENSYKNNNLSQLKCGSNNCPCPNDNPIIMEDDTCSCTGDGSGGPHLPPDDKD